jgi:hypothetical protein
MAHESARTRRRAAIAVAAAYGLALYALLLAFGGGLHAAAPGSHGHVLCSRDQAPNGAPGQAGGELCCVLVCFDPAAAGPGAPAVAGRIPARRVDGEVRYGAALPVLLRPALVCPFGARAPPVAG